MDKIFIPLVFKLFKGILMFFFRRKINSIFIIGDRDLEKRENRELKMFDLGYELSFLKKEG